MQQNDFGNDATSLHRSSFYSTKLLLIEKKNKQTNKAKQNKAKSMSVRSIKCILIYLTLQYWPRWKRTQDGGERKCPSISDQVSKSRLLGKGDSIYSYYNITDYQERYKVQISLNTIKTPLKGKWTSTYTII